MGSNSRIHSETGFSHSRYPDFLRLVTWSRRDYSENYQVSSFGTWKHINAAGINLQDHLTFSKSQKILVLDSSISLRTGNHKEFTRREVRGNETEPRRKQSRTER